MLASFSSFLPSVLHPTDKAYTPDEKTDPPSDDEPRQSDAMAVDEAGMRRKKEKTNETFIFVRPPPAKTNHPLNLQVQLVPPNTRTPGVAGTGSSNGRPSLDFNVSPPTATDTPTTTSFAEQQQSSDRDLSRTVSNRSEASLFSYSSTTSFGSVSSTSTGSGRRMIIPLYNLQAHNVLTNTIVDAGTDAKIAKFQKRGLELMDLAVLEPVEVWVPAAAGRPSIDGGNGSSFLSKKTSSSLLPGSPAGRSATLPPPSPEVSQPSTPEPPSSPMPLPATPAPVTPAPMSKRKMFGNLFKKKDAVPPTPPSASTTPTPSRPSRQFASTALSPAPPTDADATPPATPSSATTSPSLRPPVLGIQPALSAPHYPPAGRPDMYVWVVRRWLKGGDGSLLGGMIGKLGGGGGGLGLGLGAPAAAIGAVEVTFEWKRGRSARRRARSATGGGGSRGPSRRASVIGASASDASLTAGAGAGPAQLASPEAKRLNRLSTVSTRTTSTTVTSEEPGRSRSRSRPGSAEREDGAESDPEDSETPWTCTLKVKRLRGAGAGASAGGASPLPAEDAEPAVVRIKVGTLSPTPHHPKVVAMLKVPFPLPDVGVERLAVRRRVLTAGGAVLRAEAPAGELALSAEEVKDVVCCTGLWLVVREGFGGVGRVSRKGDGWRIRA